MKILMLSTNDKEVADNLGLTLNECGASAVEVNDLNAVGKEFDCELKPSILNNSKYIITAVFIYDINRCIDAFKSHKYVKDNNIFISDVDTKDLRARYFKIVEACLMASR